MLGKRKETLKKRRKRPDRAMPSKPLTTMLFSPPLPETGNTGGNAN
jgi:hypothetical protein